MKPKDTKIVLITMVIIFIIAIIIPSFLDMLWIIIAAIGIGIFIGVIIYLLFIHKDK